MALHSACLWLSIGHGMPAKTTPTAPSDGGCLTSENNAATPSMNLLDASGPVQVVISYYERGKLRLSAEMALRFATALDFPILDLLHTGSSSAVDAAPKPSRRLLRRLELIEHLPRRKQAALLDFHRHLL